MHWQKEVSGVPESALSQRSVVLVAALRIHFKFFHARKEITFPLWLFINTNRKSSLFYIYGFIDISTLALKH